MGFIFFKLLIGLQNFFYVYEVELKCMKVDEIPWYKVAL